METDQIHPEFRHHHRPAVTDGHQIAPAAPCVNPAPARPVKHPRCPPARPHTAAVAGPGPGGRLRRRRGRRISGTGRGRRGCGGRV